MSRARVTAFPATGAKRAGIFSAISRHRRGWQDRRVRRGFRFCRKPHAAHQRQQADRTDQLQRRDQRRDHYDGEELTPHLPPVPHSGLLRRLAVACRPPSRCDRLIRNIAVGRRMKRSATSAATIEKALSQPNRRSDGRSENTVTTRPQASTTVVRISAGPTSTVARSTASSGVTPGLDSSLSRLRK